MPAFTNEFIEPQSYDHKIGSKTGGVIGEIRIKPSSILWKSKSAQKWKSVPLDIFVEWITKNGKVIGK